MPLHESNSQPDRLLRIHEVLRTVGLSRTWWLQLVKAGTAPKPVKLGPKAVGWYQSEVQQFIKTRVRAEYREAA